MLKYVKGIFIYSSKNFEHLNFCNIQLYGCRNVTLLRVFSLQM